MCAFVSRFDSRDFLFFPLVAPGVHRPVVVTRALVPRQARSLRALPACVQNSTVSREEAWLIEASRLFAGVKILSCERGGGGGGGWGNRGKSRSMATESGGMLSFFSFFPSFFLRSGWNPRGKFFVDEIIINWSIFELSRWIDGIRLRVEFNDLLFG